MFISIIFPNIARQYSMKRWKLGCHLGLMQIQHLCNTYFFVVLICCSGHLLAPSEV